MSFFQYKSAAKDYVLVYGIVCDRFGELHEIRNDSFS